MDKLLTGNGAKFSECGKYRYNLWRHFGDDQNGNGFINFIMLNPSTADAESNDPTVSRCIERAKQLGYGGLIVTNLFAYRSTDPKLLNKIEDPVGPENDNYILSMAMIYSSRVICGWGGSNKLIKERAKQVVGLLRQYRLNLNYLRMSKASGQPWHPLYLPYSELPKEWSL